MENEKPNYYAVIPATVRYDEKLRANEKLMYGELTALSNKTGVCYASNNYFARLYKTTPQAISRWILNLKQYGYIEIEYEYEGSVIKKRKIKVSTNIDTYQQKVDGGINICLEGYQQNVKENNTSNNNTSINNKENIKEREIVDNVIQYLNERLGTQYRTSTPSTRKHILARIHEGYNIFDFAEVIESKYDEWHGTDMEKYLRPDTLFGTKFEIYLNNSKWKKDN